MNKILVSVYVPSINKNYDVYIPFKIKFYEVVKIVAAMIEEISERNYIATDAVVLCEKSTGIIYNLNLSSEELGLRNGSKLILI